MSVLRLEMRLAMLAVVCFFAAAQSPAAAPSPKNTAPADAVPGNEATPAALVRAALRSELDGPSDVRASLLNQALSRDPAFAPARWQSGFVRYENDWVTLDEAAKRAGDDKQLAAYRKQRDALVDTADNHRTLARWCHKHKLADEGRIHWAKVLEFEPGDAEALAALGLQLYQGRLLTRKQIEDAKKLAGEQLRATQHWHPLIVKWCHALEHRSTAERSAAREQLLAISDHRVIPVLDQTLSAAHAGQPGNPAMPLYLQLLGKFTVPEATQRLLVFAVWTDSDELRRLACEELRKHPQQAYVPQLIAALPDDVKVTTSYQLFLSPYFAFDQHQIYMTDGHSERLMNLWNEAVSQERPSVPAEVVMSEAAAIERRVANRVANFNAHQAAWRNRIASVLAQTSDFRDINDRQVLLQRWNDFTDSYVPPAPALATTSEVTFHAIYRQFSCFPAGTQVASDLGPVPIEKIRLGDRVLSQDPQTGELAYKVVQGVTLRPAAPLIKISIGPDAISATRGHPFWVNGERWLMAKQLEPGMVLHTPRGAVVIDNLEEAPAKEAYNLIVSDFNTYFVGPQQILVHDNLPFQETLARVPGLIENDSNQQLATDQGTLEGAGHERDSARR